MIYIIECKDLKTNKITTTGNEYYFKAIADSVCTSLNTIFGKTHTYTVRSK